MDRIDELIERQQRIKNGLINCIPLCFKRFSRYYPGIEVGKYGIIAAAQKAGKTKLVDKMFMYEPFFYSVEHPDEVDLHIIYFPLESNYKDKIDELYCFLLWRLDGIIIDKKTLKSTEKDNPCPDFIFEKLKSKRYKQFIDKFLDVVDFYDGAKHPTAIFNHCEKFAKANGEWTYRDGKRQNEDGEWVEGKVKDSFIPYKNNSYWIVILDNFANINTESGLDQRKSIEKMSKYCITLRDDYKFNVNVIQHLNLASEDTSGRNFGHEIDLTPNANNLGDAKTTVRDINSMMSIFYPFKYGIKSYPADGSGYDITKFGSYIRFLKMCENRDDESGKQIALFFIGQIGEFYELPPPSNPADLEYYYDLIKILDYMKAKNIVGSYKDFAVYNGKVIRKEEVMFNGMRKNETSKVLIIKELRNNFKKMFFNQK